MEVGVYVKIKNIFLMTKHKVTRSITTVPRMWNWSIAWKPENTDAFPAVFSIQKCICVLRLFTRFPTILLAFPNGFYTCAEVKRGVNCLV